MRFVTSFALTASADAIVVKSCNADGARVAVAFVERDAAERREERTEGGRVQLPVGDVEEELVQPVEHSFAVRAVLVAVVQELLERGVRPVVVSVSREGRLRIDEVEHVRDGELHRGLRVEAQTGVAQLRCDGVCDALGDRGVRVELRVGRGRGVLALEHVDDFRVERENASREELAESAPDLADAELPQC